MIESMNISSEDGEPGTDLSVAAIILSPSLLIPRDMTGFE
jgi:hypothetical protein